MSFCVPGISVIEAKALGQVREAKVLEPGPKALTPERMASVLWEPLSAAVERRAVQRQSIPDIERMLRLVAAGRHPTRDDIGCR